MQVYASTHPAGLFSLRRSLAIKPKEILTRIVGIAAVQQARLRKDRESSVGLGKAIWREAAACSLDGACARDRRSTLWRVRLPPVGP
jgi:hypothetical protein